MGHTANRWPEPDPRPFVRFAKIEAGKQFSFVILSARLYIWDLHYSGEGHKPCTKHRGHCFLCGPKNKARWGGILGVLSVHQRLTLLLGITPGAAAHCPELQQLDGHLRGKLIHVARMGSTNQSGLRIHIADSDSRITLPANLPEVNVPGACSRWWNCPLEDLLGDGPETEPPCP